MMAQQKVNGLIISVFVVVNLGVMRGFAGVGLSQVTYEELHAFTQGGFEPVAGLIQASDGNLYGTTQSGGTFGQDTVYKITTGGAFTLLHSFDCSMDGCNLFAGLIQASDGNLYGTTQGGGTFSGGTVYKITTGGAFTLLHSFACSVDGCNPLAGLMQASDTNLYGTTFSGGTFGGGTVYRITTGGRSPHYIPLTVVARMVVPL